MIHTETTYNLLYTVYFCIITKENKDHKENEMKNQKLY